MSNYKTLANVSLSENVTQWRFRVNFIRIFPKHVEEQKPYIPAATVWHFVLADEAGSRIEMFMFPKDAKRFKGNEHNEGTWAEISNVQVTRGVSTPFKWGTSRCRLQVSEDSKIERIRPLNDRHYLDFINIHEMKHVYKTDTPIDIMGVVFNVEPLDVCSADHKKTKMVFYIRDNVEFQIKCVATGDNAYAFQEGLERMMGRGVVIAVLKIWKLRDVILENPWFESYEFIYGFRFNTEMDDVERFRQSLANNDPYVAKHGPIVFIYM